MNAPPSCSIKSSHYLAPVDERQRETVGRRGAEFLHQIERKTGTAWPVGMEKANGRIKADALKRRFNVMA